MRKSGDLDGAAALVAGFDIDLEHAFQTLSLYALWVQVMAACRSDAVLF
jgi:hypothetical protein